MSLKKSWDRGWRLGGAIDAFFSKAKVKSKKPPKGEVEALILEAKEAFENSELLSNLDSYKLAASIALQGAQEAGVDLDNALIDSMMESVLDYGYFEGLFGISENVRIPETNAEKSNLKTKLRRNLVIYQNDEESLHVFIYFLAAIFTEIFKSLPKSCLQDQSDEHDGTVFDTHILNLIDDIYALVESICIEFYHQDLKDVRLFEETREILQVNGMKAAGYRLDDPASYRKDFPPPTEYRDEEPDLMIEAFFNHIPFKEIFFQKLPFVIPSEVRMEHTHVLAGSGHGKTQLLQKLILDDLNSETGFAVIDSQGDLISKLSLSSKLSPSINPDIFDKLLIIDASDVEYPTCLNLFALTDGGGDLSLKDKEILANSTVDLYTYIFSSLLGAELTARQGTIFVYIAKLMMEIPNASIITLRQLMEDGRRFEKYIDKLQGSAKAFFKTQFFSRSFNQTKQQILYRLWAILSNSTLERMFSNIENKVDLYQAMNQGKIVLINTSKQVLGNVGSEVMGKFFIAMLTQSAMKRAAIHESDRRPFHVYIDEAQEYVDDMFNQFLNQTRKYKVGFHLFHQNYDQLSATVRASILSSTSIKFAGGVSSKDARTLSEEMKTSPASIMSVQKFDRSHSEYSLFVRNVTASSIMVDVPFGLLESMPSISADEYEALVENNRSKYCRHYSEVELEEFEVDIETVEDKERLVEAEDVLVKTNTSIEDIINDVESLRPKQLPKVDEEVAPRESYRGSTKHRYLQALVQKMGNERGFVAEVESQVPSGDGFIDVVLRKDDTKIAFEINVTTPSEYEIKNLKKCLLAGYTKIAMLCADGRHLKEISKLAETEFEKSELSKIEFLNDELLPQFLDSKEHKGIEDEVNKMHGYKVNVSVGKLSDSERQAKQKIIDSILLNARS